MTSEQWLAARGFHRLSTRIWRRDNVVVDLGGVRALCRMYGDWGVTSVSVPGDTAELAVSNAVAAIGDAHRRALAILEGA